jgi:hypothetical protein
MNLSWVIAAHVNGWADEAILNAYEAERLPITDQVSRFAMNIALNALGQRRSVPQNIEEIGPDGDRVRRQFGQQVYDLNVQQFCCGGLNFGAFYENSPVIAYDGEAAPGYDLYNFQPSTVPGCRTPHVWLADGRSLYDALGAEFTLLRLDKTVDVEPLREAARLRSVPLDVVDVDAPDAIGIFRRKLVISRPDLHVAWRGDALPADPLSLVDLIRGAQSSAENCITPSASRPAAASASK